MTILVLLHVLAAIVWVGGMFFAYLVLRPSAGPLDVPVRLALWRRVFGRFFPWVWASVVLLLATGVLMIVIGFGGFETAGLYISLMMSIGIVMMLLFAHLYFAPWRRFQRALDGGDMAAAGRNLTRSPHRRDQPGIGSGDRGSGRRRALLVGGKRAVQQESAGQRRGLKMAAIRITRRIAIDEAELRERFVLASGPGGRTSTRSRPRCSCASTWRARPRCPSRCASGFWPWPGIG